jgi:hypothetical protein
VHSYQVAWPHGAATVSFMSQRVPWSELHVGRGYWLLSHDPVDPVETHRGEFLGWKVDGTEATFVLHFPGGQDRSEDISPTTGQRSTTTAQIAQTNPRQHPSWRN